MYTQIKMTKRMIHKIKKLEQKKEHKKNNRIAEFSKKYRQILKPLEWFSIFLLVFLPFVSVPNWCMKADLYKEGSTRDGHCNREEYPNSNITMWPPYLTESLRLLAYIFLSMFLMMRVYNKNANKARSKARYAFLGLSILACFID